jgi:hypothetical protein
VSDKDFFYVDSCFLDCLVNDYFVVVFLLI